MECSKTICICNNQESRLPGCLSDHLGGDEKVNCFKIPAFQTQPTRPLDVSEFVFANSLKVKSKVREIWIGLSLKSRRPGWVQIIVPSQL